MAVQFNGTDQGLSVGGARGQFRNLAAASISAWARIEGVTAATRIITKFSTGLGVNTTRISLGITTSNTIEVGIRILDGDSLSSHSFTPSPAIALGVWHHYVLAVDYALKRFYCYYDGTLTNSTQMANPTAGNTSDTASLTGGIGLANPPTGNSFFAGSLDEVIFYNRLLGPAEAQTLYAGRGRACILDGITGCWQLAEGAAGVTVAQAVDVSGLGGSASPIGTPVYIGGLTDKRRRRHRGNARR